MKKCMQFVCNCLLAACMLYINNCMYAAHNNCTHLAYIYSDVCDLMWHACGAEPIFMYAAYMCAARVQRKEANICAAHKQPFCKG